MLNLSITNAMDAATSHNPQPLKTTKTMNRRPRILLGITGSVAAVKGPKLALRLAKEVNADVRVVLTRTVEQYFWKDGRAVSSYDVESWRDLLASTSTATKIEEDREDGDSCASKGRIFLHCKQCSSEIFSFIFVGVLPIEF